jgi:hypothetical protein
MFFNTTSSEYARLVYNPVQQGASSGGGGGSGGSGQLAIIDNEFYNSLYTIEQRYGLKMAEKLYENIPNDYNAYILLYVQVQLMMKQVTDYRLLILLKLAQEALKGAINSYALYGTTITLTYDKNNLQKTIADILSGKNNNCVASATGNLSITKTFKLANVFNAYLIIYGMPSFGVGFDPIKINFLVDVLKQNGIEPYK